MRFLPIIAAAALALSSIAPTAVTAQNYSPAQTAMPKHCSSKACDLKCEKGSLCVDFCGSYPCRGACGAAFKKSVASCHSDCRRHPCST